MKTNAARELLALVDAWGSTGAVSAVRDRSDAQARTLWEAQIRAVRLLGDVEAFLALDESPEENSDLIHALRTFVFAPNGAWTTTHAVLSSSDRMQLKFVARLMDSSPFAVSMDPADVGALNDALHQALNVLDRQTGDVEQRIEHACYLLRRSLDLLDGEPIDLLGLRSITYEAAGAGAAAADLLSEEDRDEVGESLGRAVRTWGPAVVTGAAGELVATGIKGLLGA